MVDMTDHERAAIKYARRYFAEALGELGLMEPFRNRSAAEIDQVITACVTGFQEFLHNNPDDSIPF